MSKINILIFTSIAIIILAGFQLYQLWQPFSDLPSSTSKETNNSIQVHTAVSTQQEKINLNKPTLQSEVFSTCSIHETSKSLEKTDLNELIIIQASLDRFTHNHHHILDTLINDYGLTFTKDYLDYYSRFSIHHLEVAPLKEKLINTLKKAPMNRVKPFHVRLVKPEFNHETLPLEQLVLLMERYPDLHYYLLSSAIIWDAKKNQHRLLKSLIYKAADTPLHPMTSTIVTNAFFFSILNLKSDKETKQSLINDLSIINSGRLYHHPDMYPHLDRLIRLDYDFSQFKLTNLARMKFSSHSQLTRKWETLKKSYYLEQPKPNVLENCSDGNQLKTYKKKLITSEQVTNTQKIHTFAEHVYKCSRGDNLQLAIDTIEQQWPIATLFSIENLKQATFKNTVKKLKDSDKLPTEYLFSYISSYSLQDKAQRYEQLSLMVSNDIHPKDSSIAKAFNDISVEQSMTLIEQAGPLEAVDKNNATLVYNALLFNNHDLALALIKKNYPLISNSNSPDPLSLLLYQLLEKRTYEYPEELDELIETVITNTETISPWHINTVYRLKKKNRTLFNELIEKHPSLFPKQPDVLIEIECGDDSLQL